MKTELTDEFVSRVLKLSKEYKVQYSVQYINIEVTNIGTSDVRYINLHEFIHTHCRDFLLSYANGLKLESETKYDGQDGRIATLYFNVKLIVPNLLDGNEANHTEIFSGLSELILYINAVEWLIKYRKDNPKLSKFWINKF